MLLSYPTAAAAKSLQSCPTLCDSIDGSPPGSPIPGILQARTLEWVAIFFSSAWKWKVKVKSLNRVRLLATPWTAAYPTAVLSKPQVGSGFWARLGPTQPSSYFLRSRGGTSATVLPTPFSFLLPSISPFWHSLVNAPITKPECGH